MELPYTLSQDSTVFLVFKEPTIDIWTRKLDWVAKRGGMVLLNSHPDYMAFNGKRLQDEFPVGYYQEFLEYAKQKYAGMFWPALPREVAEHVLSQQKNRTPSGRKQSL
jgi:hypothetical protein